MARKSRKKWLTPKAWKVTPLVGQQLYAPNYLPISQYATKIAAGGFHTLVYGSVHLSSPPVGHQNGEPK